MLPLLLILPVEPSTAMALQRDPALPRAVLGVAESLPLADGTADAAMAVMTMQHWAEVDRGLAEMARVARRRIVLLTIDADVAAGTWLFSEYVPEAAERDRREFPRISHLGPAPRSSARSFRIRYRPAAYRYGGGMTARLRGQARLHNLRSPRDGRPPKQ